MMTYTKPQSIILGNTADLIQGASNSKATLPLKDSPFPDETMASYIPED
jgi:hypothetical protein